VARRPVELNVEPNEILIGPRRLKLRVRASLDPETARSAIELRSGPSNVQLSGRGRTVTVIPDGGLSRFPSIDKKEKEREEAPSGCNEPGEPGEVAMENSSASTCAIAAVSCPGRRRPQRPAG
jgi:hypothetical protein